ncbi:hypothetical protein B9479_007536, partial [Cryptococcus floricola]
VFRKWWEEVVSFEGPTKCECCDIFKKGYPKIGVMSLVQEWYSSREDKALQVASFTVVSSVVLSDVTAFVSLAISFAVPSIPVLGSVLDGTVVGRLMASH